MRKLLIIVIVAAAAVGVWVAARGGDSAGAPAGFGTSGATDNAALKRELRELLETLRAPQ